MYPTLKSNNADLYLILLSRFNFSFVHIDCQIETSRGAGIQPMKAAKKIIPETSSGNI